MNHHALKGAAVKIWQAEEAIPSELHGIVTAVGELDHRLGGLSIYGRRLSVAVAGLPDSTKHLRVSELEGPLSPQAICKPAAVHLQATAAGIDQARTAVTVAHQLAGRLHLQCRTLARPCCRTKNRASPPNQAVFRSFVAVRVPVLTFMRCPPRPGDDHV